MTELDYTFERQIDLERISAREEGLAEGLAEGQQLLADAIIRLKNGESESSLLQQNISQSTIDLAKNFL